MDINQRIEMLIEKMVAFEGYGIVRVNVSGNLRKTLQIMIEKLDNTSINVDDCEQVSKLISPLLDVENVIAESYVLEISSPGLDRPLTKPKHFQQFVGSPVAVQTNFGIKNRKKFQGMLAFASETGIKIILSQQMDDETTEIELSYDDIRSAKLHVDFDNINKQNRKQK